MVKTAKVGGARGRCRRAVAVLAAASLLFSAVGAVAADRDGYRRERGPEGHGFRPEERRHEREFRRPWRFEPRHGWRYERGPGIWSPFYVWWWLDGRAVLALAPTATILRYPQGHYELRGDGFNVPYYWVWIPAVRAAPPMPPAGVVPPPLPAPSGPPAYGRALPPAPPRTGSNETGGMIVGGAVGGVLGSTIGRGSGRTAGIIVGTLLGALVGRDVGRSLDEADELRAAQVLEKNKTGQSSTWVNPDNGAEVTVVPTRTYQEQSGEYCREYQADITVGGDKQQAYGTACRQPDGQWKLNP